MLKRVILVTHCVVGHDDLIDWASNSDTAIQKHAQVVFELNPLDTGAEAFVLTAPSWPQSWSNSTQTKP